MVHDASHHQLRRAVYMSVAFGAGLIFGVILLIDGDWIPGAIIVVATLIGLAAQVVIFHRLRHEGAPPTAPRGTPPGIA